MLQVVRKPEEGDFIGHLRAEALMEIARIFQVSACWHMYLFKWIKDSSYCCWQCQSSGLNFAAGVVSMCLSLCGTVSVRMTCAAVCKPDLAFAYTASSNFRMYTCICSSGLCFSTNSKRNHACYLVCMMMLCSLSALSCSVSSQWNDWFGT